MPSALKANGRLYEVVIIEDSRGDAGMIVNVLQQGGRRLNLVILPDGAKASAHIADAVPLEDGPLAQRRPDLILMDLDLPQRSGFELLLELRAGQRLKDVPAVIFTSSQRPGDVQRCYEAGANAVIFKPLEFEAFVATVRSIEHYWLDVVASPDFRPRV